MDKSYLPLMFTNPAETACQDVFHMDFQQMHTFKDTWRRSTQGLMKTWSWSALRKSSSEYNCFCFLFLWCLCPMTCSCPSLQEMWRFFLFPSIRFMCFFLLVLAGYCSEQCAWMYVFFFFYNFKYLVILFNNLSPQNFNCQYYHNIEYWIMILFFSSFY